MYLRSNLLYYFYAKVLLNNLRQPAEQDAEEGFQFGKEAGVDVDCFSFGLSENLAVLRLFIILISTKHLICGE